MSSPPNYRSASALTVLPWIVAGIALIIAITMSVKSDTRSAPAPAPLAIEPPGAPPAANETPLQTELADLRRILDDAQSALADRDREIAGAQAELRALKQADAPANNNSTVSPLSALSLQLQQQGVGAKLMYLDSTPVGLIILSSPLAGVLILTQPLPGIAADEHYQLWFTAAAQMPQHMSTCTGAVTTFTMPATVAAPLEFHVHRSSASESPGPIVLRTQPPTQRTE